MSIFILQRRRIVGKKITKLWNYLTVTFVQHHENTQEGMNNIVETQMINQQK